MMDWFPAVMTLVGVLVGLGVQEFRIGRARKDKYKDMIFEKRLDAHQGAYYWCMTLFELMLPYNLMKDGGVKVAAEETLKATDWLNKNALYLDEDSRLVMNLFFRYISGTCYKYLDETSRKNINVKDEALKLVEHARDVVSSIKKGIGVKYLPEPRLSSVDIGEVESLDEWGERVRELMREQKK